MVEQSILDDFIGAVKQDPEQMNNVHSAVVSRTDDEGTVWVYVAGSENETPTQSTSSEVKKGDAVNVEWRNNKLYIVGNSSNPSVGAIRVDAVERAANVANSAAASAVADAATAREAAESVQGIAVEAKTAATQAQNSLKSVVQGATTVEKAVSVMQTALEAVVDYDPQNDTVQEYFWHDANGAHVLGDTSGYRNDIDSTGMDIVEVASERSVAQFGADGARIGKEYIQGMSDNESYMTLDYHSMQMQDINGNIFLHISDLRNQDGYATVEELFTGDGNTTVFHLELNPCGSPHRYIKITVDDVEVSNYSESGGAITFSTAPSDGAEIKVTFNTADNRAKAYTVGDRATDSKIGPMSIAEGYNVTASSSYSHAEGVTTTADGQASHAEGAHCIALGAGSHAEGSDTEARTDNSHAQNNNTIASRRDQTVIGRYNIIDTHPNNSDDCYALIIGNGYHQNRSNAFTVDWNGNVEASGDVTDGNGNVLSNKADASSVPTKTSDLTNDSGFIDVSIFGNYVVEKGSTTAGSVTWKYHKWNDGMLEMWGSATTTLAIGTASGSLYTTASTYDIAMPSFVNTVEFITAELSGGGWADITAFTKPPQLRLYAPTSYGSASRDLRYYFKGTWS